MHINVPYKLEINCFGDDAIVGPIWGGGND